MYMLGIPIHDPAQLAKVTAVTNIRATHLTLIIGGNLRSSAIKLQF